MTAQQGRLFTLKIGDGGGTEIFTIIGGVRSNSLEINNTTIDVTTPDLVTPGGPLWNASIAGLKSMSGSFSGVFLDAAVDATLKTLAMAASPFQNFQIFAPDFGTFEANFHLDNYGLTGEMEGEVDFSISLTSNGAPTFVAA